MSIQEPKKKQKGFVKNDSYFPPFIQILFSFATQTTMHPSLIV